MLVSGVIAGIAAAIAFGGDWRRLSTLTLRYWPLLVVAFGLRAIGTVFPLAPLGLYVIALVGTALVATLNWRLPGAALVAIGTSMNLMVVFANRGMPFDAGSAVGVGAPLPNDSLHVLMGPETKLPFLADVIPVGGIRSVYSVGDFLIAVGGFLIPFMWLQAPAEANIARHELRSTNFAFFWLAQVMSRFGDPITLIALTYVTYRATQSALLTALAVMIATLPNALFGFFGGAIADAVGHRRAMFWCDVLRTILIGAVPILLAIEVPLAVVFVAVLLGGMCGAVFNPARVSLVPALLTPDRLAAGNSLVYASDRAVEIGGALAGGVLVATVGQSAFYIDAATFALSALLLSRVSVPELRRPLTWQRLVSDSLEGALFLRRSTVLWSNTVFSIVAQISNPVVNGLTPVFLVRRFADNDPTTGAVLFGASEASIAFGAVVGSTLLPRYVGGFRKGRLLIAGFGAMGVLIVLIAAAPAFPFALVLFGVLGVTNVIFYVPNVTILQEGTSPEIRARVFGARIALVNLSWLPIILVSGALGDTVSVPLLIGLAGALTLVTAVVGAFIPAVRDVP